MVTTINEGTLYGELAKYIEYSNGFVKESNIHSIFDYLYSQYFMERMEYLKNKKRISEYDSENLCYSLLLEIIEELEIENLSVACHVRLSSFIDGNSKLIDTELQYLLNPLSHVDFLIINKMDKTPVVGIEVDGVAFHEEGSKQEKRDRIKDKIFTVSNIPLLRLRTDESNEKERIKMALKALV